ncbi:RNA polymerase factor sigma C [Virgibacillus profundi]|uniref:RNA polymerase factor sigma C n=1 Tax=Virgibacillus profundi TaxID=2024555 RepID=A0A2A2IBZ1_9BACI|nr:sigma-70 family RNA polymerase sigma factor [Virgibacillus profundi]PAV29137.1 RNA polymerase factor sigma C [Virgibacillus profundi]PXY53306.1 RNA polymerase factor sigma C [Virgibacillus profundi]
MEEVSAEAFQSEDKAELIDQMMTQYGQEILHLAYSYVNSKEIAEDLTQEIFIKCYNSLHTFKGKSKLRTWLWQIAINHCKDYLKSWYYKNVTQAENEKLFDKAQAISVEQAFIQKDEDEKLVNAIMDLPVKYREVIFLFYFEDLTIKELATLIGINQNTIKTRLKRAKELLKKRLEGN